MGMFENGFDAIIIGAGHNGMALAAYLAKSGWSVAVLERRTEEGGGLSTEEVTEPNFLHNLHSNYHSLVGLSPAYDDLGLHDNGIEYAHPDVQMGSVFADGTALTIHTDMRKTYESFARFSKKDADTWMRLWDEVGGYMDLMVRTLMYAPPIKLNDLTRALASWGVEERSEFLTARLRTISVAEFLDKHFENDRIKAMLAFHAAICAYQPHIKGLAVTLPVLLGKITNWQLCKGGSHPWRTRRSASSSRPAAASSRRCPSRRSSSRTAALSAYARRMGLCGPTSWWRRASTGIRPSKSFSSPRWRRPAQPRPSPRLRTRTPRCSRGLRDERFPALPCRGVRSDIDRAWILNIGFESLADFKDDFDRIRQGLLPETPRLNVAVNSLYDPTDAPEGMATGLIRVFAPFALADGGPEAWRSAARAYGERCVERWAGVCTNLDDGLIRKWVTETPHDISQKIINYRYGDWMVGRIHPKSLLEHRPTDELSEYRTPIKGLYMCGASQHPHGYITFGPATIAWASSPTTSTWRSGGCKSEACGRRPFYGPLPVGSLRAAVANT